MGRSQKQKGNRIERKIVKILQENGFEATRTWGSSGRSLGLELEEQLDSTTASLQQANEVVTFVFNITSLWQKKDIGNYRAIKTINDMFVIKEKNNDKKS